MGIFKQKRITTFVIIFLSLLLAVSPMTGLYAQSSGNITKAPADLPTTGFEDSNGDSWTTLDEEREFLEEVASKSDRVTYSQVGTSVEERSIYLVKVGNSEPPSDEEIANGRNILIAGTPHGSEPAGREMALKMLRNLAFTDNPEKLNLLSKTTILFMPTPNPDGRYANTRENANGYDVNRDHLKLETPEGKTQARVMNKFNPDIIVDAHERPGDEANPDVEVLWPRNLNVDEQLRQLNMEMVQDYVRSDVEEDGFTTGLYGTAPWSGSGSERILRNMGGLRHSLSILVETPGQAEPKSRVQMHMSAAKSVLRFYRERFEDVGEVKAEAPQRSAEAGANQEAFYLDGTYGWDFSEYPPIKLDPAPSGYLINTSQAEEISRQIKLFSLETKEIGENGVFFTMTQPMRTIIPLLLDEKAEYNEVIGIPLYASSNPGTAANMKTLVEHFKEQGEIQNDSEVHALKVHLTTVDQFEEQGAAEKVVKHMNGFKLLLDRQKESTSERAFSVLNNYADYIIEKWQ